MVVQHNLQAMNSNRMLGVTQKSVASATEKLSSGYKINRAADNAAGLAISEKMRKQIRGLSQASANAEDGISTVQTAEGALQEVTDMLQRMNELAVQAANGTNAEKDRQAIQDELDQLVSEIDRVAETTKFNETYLLKGDQKQASTKIYSANYTVTYTLNLGSNKADVAKKVDYIGTANVYMVASTITTATVSSPMTAEVVKKGDDFTKYLDGGETVEVKANGTIDGAEDNLKESENYIAFKNATLLASKMEYDSTNNIISSKAGEDTYILNTNTNEVIRVAEDQDLSDYLKNVETSGTTVSFAEMKDEYRVLKQVGGEDDAAKSDYDSDAAADLAATDFKANESLSKLYDASGNEVSGIALSKYFDENGNYTEGLYKDSQATDAITSANITDFTAKKTSYVAADLSFSLHVGSDSASSNKIETSVQAMSAAALGINKLASTSIGIVDATGNNATDAVDIIADALQKVSTQRSALGAVQNRLEHTIKNLDNVVENTQSAESAIRDTDMAEEMVAFSNANILSQAGQSMLAQANQSNQGVLAILG